MAAMALHMLCCRKGNLEWDGRKAVWPSLCTGMADSPACLWESGMYQCSLVNCLFINLYGFMTAQCTEYAVCNWQHSIQVFAFTTQHVSYMTDSNMEIWWSVLGCLHVTNFDFFAHSFAEIQCSASLALFVLERIKSLIYFGNHSVFLNRKLLFVPAFYHQLCDRKRICNMWLFPDRSHLEQLSWEQHCSEETQILKWP